MLLSEMNTEQLQGEMDKLRDQGQAAFDSENWDDYGVLMQKWYLAKSYQLLPTFKLKIGHTYKLAEEYDMLTATRQDGVMAWGIRESSADESAVPIAMLVEKDV